MEEDKIEPNFNKRLSSAFRERMEEDNGNGKDLTKDKASNLISDMERTGKYNYENDDYEDLLRELSDKYRRPFERNAEIYFPEKGIVYPNLGVDTTTDRKHNQLYNGGYSYTYLSNDELENDEDGSYSPKHSIGPFFQREHKRKVNRSIQKYPYNPYKQYQLKKRSSNFQRNAMSRQHKRSTTKRQTDPNVEKALRNIFGSKSTQLSTIQPVVVKPIKLTEEKKNVSEIDHNITIKPSLTSESVTVTNVSALSEKPLQIKKKSVDWSDYFGLDKKKRTDSDNLDKEWLIEKYHKSISMSAKKRNSDFQESQTSKRSSNEITDEERIPKKKLDDIDDKLQTMEESIVEEALKFTGAHDGETNPKKLRKIKDRLMSRLAAAYSLEKMRQALGEYKSLVSDSNVQQTEDEEPSTDEKLAAKRSAIPRKQVVDKDRENSEDADNNVKCAEGDEDCFEQNYKTPTDVVESYLGSGRF